MLGFKERIALKEKLKDISKCGYGLLKGEPIRVIYTIFVAFKLCLKRLLRVSPTPLC